MTSQPARAPLKVHPAILVAIIAVCATVLLYLFWPIAFLVGQIYLLIIVLLGFRYWPPMIGWIKRMPIPHRIVFALLIGGIIAGHFTLNTRKYFPFMAWEIFPFVREEDSVICRELIATTASGKNVRLLVEQLVPSIVQFNLPQDPVATEHLVHALARIYNQHHADDPIQQVELMAMAVKLHPPGNELRTEPSCEFLQRYDISSGR